RRALPVDLLDEATFGVGDRVRGDAADTVLTVAEGAVLAALFGGGEHLGAAVDELAGDVAPLVLLARRLLEPVQRQPDAHHEQPEQAPGERAVELAPLELLVGEVGLAVGG